MTTTPPLHAGVNVLLGGAMMSGMLIVVVCICYCCHKRVNKPEYNPDQWLQVPEETDSTLQIFTLEQQCFEIAAEAETPRTPSPPPPYDEVVTQQKKYDLSPPSYAAAVKLAANGYV
ncbi:spermiogenesis-related protein stanley-cup isoform X2 [Lycorma delicatula]